MPYTFSPCGVVGTDTHPCSYIHLDVANRMDRAILADPSENCIEASRPAHLRLSWATNFGAQPPQTTRSSAEPTKKYSEQIKPNYSV